MKMSEKTAEEGQCGTWSTPEKSKVLQVCAPTSQLRFLQKQMPSQEGSEGTGRVVLGLWSSSSGT